jgi:hypothetical protein
MGGFPQRIILTVIEKRGIIYGTIILEESQPRRTT